MVTNDREYKLIHQYKNMGKDVLYEIFMDLQKAYDALDREKCLKIITAYGVGFRALWLLRTYLVWIAMVDRD